jgi:hypothetical protein
MNSFLCPLCEEINEIETDELPEKVCDDMAHECQHCDGEMTIGWYAEVEVRSIVVSAGDVMSDDEIGEQR